MAEDKKSFIAYCDWGEIFDELEDAEAGKLVKHLFKYVRDENPEASDKLTKMMFIQIKQSLKRDLVKYDKYKVKQSLNGKKGGRPKKAKESQITQPFIEKPKKADSVNVSVNVNEIKSKEQQPSPLNLLVKDLHPNKVAIFKEWITYRKEIKKPLKIESTVKALIKKFNANPIHVITHVVNLSIENNWTGLFWEKYNDNNTDVVGINGKRLGSAPTPLN